MAACLFVGSQGYLIVDEAAKICACIDPVEPLKVLAAAAALGVRVALSLTTHGHWDHAGGNEQLHKLLPDIEIIGGVGDNCPGATHEVGHDDILTVSVGE